MKLKCPLCEKDYDNLASHLLLKHKVKLEDITKEFGITQFVSNTILDKRGNSISKAKKGKNIVPRELRKCRACNNIFKVKINSKKQFCCQKCSSGFSFPMTEEGKRKISSTTKGRKKLDVHKQKIKESNIKTKNSKKWKETETYKNMCKNISKAREGIKPWNLNLTKEKDLRVAKYGKNVHKTKTSKEWISSDIYKNMCDKQRQHAINRPPYNPVKYKEKSYRSSYEVEVVKYLEKNNIKFEYESKNCIFELPNDRVYIIDFYLPDLDKYIEVKGYWDEYSKYKYKEASKKLNICIIDSRNIENISLNIFNI